MKILVTGGAGYIGSHTVRAFKSAGCEPTIFDNLSAGHRAIADRTNVPLIEGDLCDADAIKGVFANSTYDVVVHFAALAYVGESVRDPAKYYRNNVVGTLNLLRAMVDAKVRRIVFSSTCATYGVPATDRIDESHIQSPINPYGRTKLAAEWMLEDFHVAYGLQYAALRYFNAAGASEDGLLGEDHDPETHLIPLCLRAAIGEIPKLVVYGDDYDTPDGTCVRDYVHVEDLAEAHVLASSALMKGNERIQLNVGVGKGHSVRDVIACVEKTTGKRVPFEIGPRRPGDPAKLVAAAERIRRELGWRPRHETLESIVQTAWRWVKSGGRYPKDGG